MLVFRLTRKLAKKLDCEDILNDRELCENPYLDWSANLFRVGRIEYIILTNTSSFYSMILYSRGMKNDCDNFIEVCLGMMKFFMEADGTLELFDKFIEPHRYNILFSKSLNRHVLGSINNLIHEAKYLIGVEELSIFDASVELNEMPMFYLKDKYSTIYPKEAFMEMNKTQ